MKATRKNNNDIITISSNKGLFIIATLMVFIFSSCVKKNELPVISVSIAPESYFVERIAGDGYKINVLVPRGTNPENYDPTPQDIARLGESDLYFYMGSLGFEKIWLDAIKQQNKGMRSIDISRNLSTISNDSIPEKSYDHEYHAHHDDPHYWTSIKGAVAISKGIYDALLEAYPDDAPIFAANYDNLLKEIKALEEECRVTFENPNSRTFVIYHPSLTFFAHEWGLKQLVIENEGKEPTAAHLTNIINEAKSDSTKIVFVQEEFDQNSAKTIAKEIGAKTITIHPLSEDWYNEMRNIIAAFK